MKPAECRIGEGTRHNINGIDSRNHILESSQTVRRYMPDKVNEARRSAATYREWAENCARQAATTSDAASRENLEQLSKQWAKLADVAERRERKAEAAQGGANP